MAGGGAAVAGTSGLSLLWLPLGFSVFCFLGVSGLESESEEDRYSLEMVWGATIFLSLFLTPFGLPGFPLGLSDLGGFFSLILSAFGGLGVLGILGVLGDLRVLGVAAFFFWKTESLLPEIWNLKIECKFSLILEYYSRSNLINSFPKT